MSALLEKLEALGQKEYRHDPLVHPKVSIYQPDQPGLIFPGIPEFDDVARTRQYLKERLVGACRAFARQGFDYGFAGHLTIRDPEHPNLYWTNPMAVHFAQVKVSNLILVDHQGQVVEGRHAVNRAGFVLHAAVHEAHPDIHVRVLTTDQLVDVGQEQVDVAIRYGLGTYPGVQVEKLMDAPVFPVCAPGTSRKDGKPIASPADLADVAFIHDQSAEGRAAIADLLWELQSTFTRLENLRIPVIVAIQGGCIGGAVDMVTACCLRYASADAFFCIQEINIGMVADVGTLQRLPKLVPLAVVKELAYTGRRLGAARAQALGLVNEVFDSHQATVDAALQCAREIAAKPPVAVWGTKQAVNYARDHSVEDSLRQMGWLQGAIWSNAHVREAIAAMKEKRPGQFTALSHLKGFSEQG